MTTTTKEIRDYRRFVLRKNFKKNRIENAICYLSAISENQEESEEIKKEKWNEKENYVKEMVLWTSCHNNPKLFHSFLALKHYKLPWGDCLYYACRYQRKPIILALLNAKKEDDKTPLLTQSDMEPALLELMNTGNLVLLFFVMEKDPFLERINLCTLVNKIKDEQIRLRFAYIFDV